jgi:hypothetical protein
MGKSAENVLRFPDGASPGDTFIGTDVASGERVYIQARARAQATTLIGTTGFGKTNALLGMLTQDMRQGRSVVLVEPHGDLVRAAVGNIPKERLPDTILLNVQEDASVGLNPFECADLRSPTEVAKTAAFLFHAFTAIWSIGPETPVLTQTLRHLIRLCVEAQATLDMIPRILGDDGLRARLLSQVRAGQTRAFWEAYGLKNRRDRELQVSSVVNKLDALLAEPLIARILCQSRSTIDFGKAMREGRIVLILLPPALEEATRLLGSLLISRILLSMFHRAEVAQGQRREVALYCDEYSRFASPDFAVLLAEQRKFGLLTTIAFQALAQLDPVNQAAAQSAGTLIVYRVNGEDAGILAKNFNTTPPRSQEIVGEQPVRGLAPDPVGFLLRHAHPHPVVRQLTSQFLLPLDTLLQKLMGHAESFHFGGVWLYPAYVVEAKKLLSQALFAAMETGRADVFLHPLALYILGYADSVVRDVFEPHLRLSWWHAPGEFLGMKESAMAYGRGDFLSDERAVATLLREHPDRWVRTEFFGPKRLLTPGRSFLRLLGLVRDTMAILAKAPLLESTGQFSPRFAQPRSFSDVAGERANELSQMPPYHARVRLVAGEHLIKSHPAPQGLTGALLEARITRITRQMRFLGVTRPAAEIDEEIRKRHDRLRGGA